MMALAAARLGYRCHILDPHEHPCAAEVSAHLHARRSSTTSRRSSASPTGATSSLTNSRISRSRRSRCSATSCCPARAVLEVAQDRGVEKRFLEAMRRPRCSVARGRWRGGYHVRAWRRSDRRSCSRAVATAMTARVRPGSVRPSEAATAWEAIGRQPAVAEARIDFDAEFSVVLARDRNGETAAFPLTRNQHEDGILRTSTRSGRARRSRRSRTRRLPRPGRSRNALGHVGVLTVEFFACAGRPDRQRDCAPRSQQRPLDDRGRAYVTVRAASSRHPRAAAGRLLRWSPMARRWKI